MMRFLLAFWGASLAAQTQLDLRTQSKSVDFQGAPSTRPLKTGATLPASCSPGEMFFLTAGAAGQNVYGCSSANSWTVESGSGGSITVQSSGSPVGARAILDMAAGSGVVLAVSDTGQAIRIQPSADTGTVQTHAASQSGAQLKCSSSGGSASAYSCSLSPLLTAYTAGMVLHWVPDVSAAGGATSLNVDSLGAVAVKLANGSSDPAAGDIIAGRLYEIWHDGNAFRVFNAPVTPGALGESRPACDASERGRTWFVAGGTGVKDGFSVCAKDLSDAYAWRDLY